MKQKAIIIQGSSRSQGDTHKMVTVLLEKGGIDFVDLRKMKIDHYDYEYANRDDDFFPLIQKLLLYDIWIFATPVYWYTMSGLTKVFLDRITDLMKIKKDWGRLLNGKKLGLISCSSNETRAEGFETPFRESAHYLRMDYIGGVNGWTEEGLVPDKIRKELSEYHSKIIKDLF